MSVTDGQLVNAAVSNAAFVSRTQDTSAVGVVSILNTTESTTNDNGALVVDGGVGIEKNLNVGGSISAAGNLTVGGGLTVTGDLSVLGSSTILQTSTLQVEDKNIEVNLNGSDATAQGSGFTINRTGTPGSLVYDSSLASRFKSGDQGAESEIAVMAGTQIFTGSKTFSGQLFINNNFTSAITSDNTTTGSLATIALGSSRVHKLTNASLISVQGMDVVAGKELILINGTGVAFNILNDVGSPASSGILTGTGSDIEVAIDSVVYLIYDSGPARWRIIGGTGSGGGGVGYQEVPAGVVDGTNDTFGPLTYLPSDDNSVVVFVDGIARPMSQWGLTGTLTKSVVFNASHKPQTDQSVYVFYLTEGSTTPSPAPTGTWNVEYFTLSAGEITAKAITLGSSPSVPSKVLLDIIGGTAQEYAVDYSVSASTLTWNALALDGILVAGDKLRVVYLT